MKREIHRGPGLEYLVLSPESGPAGASWPLLVWLHGFGADMEDLAGLASAVHPSGYRHVLPNAPLGGFGGPEGTVRAWYERGGKERPDSVRLALAGLGDFFGDVQARFGVPASQSLLLGFSQGGALALRYGLSRPPGEQFAGLASLSGSLRQADDLRENLPVGRELPIFLAHGSEDSLVPVEWSRGVAAFLKAQGFDPVYQEYSMGHEIGLALVGSLVRWIGKTLPAFVA